MTALILHLIFIALHIIAGGASLGLALIFTIPLHIIVGLMLGNNARNEKALKQAEKERKENNKKYEFVFIDMFRKKATWANRDNQWFMLVKSPKDKPPKIGEKILVLREDKTFSYEKVDEVLEYIQTKHLGYRWLCRHADLERID